MNKLVLVDDDVEIRDLLKTYLNKNGFEVADYGSGESLLGVSYADASLMILDVGLPGIDGLELCRKIRSESDVPIIMLTAASDDVDRILGLELGADDYVGKPFNPRELLARIKALLRRSKPDSFAPVAEVKTALEIDIQGRVARYAGHNLDLTGAEFELLRVLHREAGTIVTRDQLSMELKGFPASPFDRSIDTQVSRLRSKLQPFCENDPIRSVRGRGYQLVLA